MPRKKPKAKLKPGSVYSMVEQAVAGALRGGYFRAFKYNDRPDMETILDNQLSYVMTAICEVVDLD